MRNLSIGWKIGILIAVILTGDLIKSSVALHELSRVNDANRKVVDVIAHNVEMVNRLKVQIAHAIRFEKNAVLTTSAQDGRNHADQSRKAIEQAQMILQEIIPSFESAAPEARNMIGQMNRALDDLQKHQQQVLELAVLNTNVQATSLLTGKLAPKFDACRAALTLIKERSEREASALPAAEASGDKKLKLAQKIAKIQNLIGKTWELEQNLYVHISQADESAMSRSDRKIEATLRQLDEGLRSLITAGDERDISDLNRVIPQLEEWGATVGEITRLSHINSNTRSLELTLTQTMEKGSKVLALTDSLEELASAQMRKSRDDSEWIYRSSQFGSSAGFLFSVFVAVVTGIWIIRMITIPLNKALRVLDAISRGDLTQRLVVDQHDEVGRMSKAMNLVSDQLLTMMTKIRDASGRMGSASNQMNSAMQSMAAGSEQISMSVAGISAATEEISTNVSSISMAAQNTSRNVQSANDSVAKIDKALNEIAADAAQGSKKSSEAHGLSREASQSIVQLSKAAKDITKVTDTIKSIALQTNLLALNATIEATTAGDAGKGFAVVAGEIKELANQSGRAAEDIERRIQEVQAQTGQTVEMIQKIASLFREVDEASNRISGSVGEQTHSTGLVASNVSQAAEGITEIARSLAEVGKGMSELSRNASEAAKGATEVSRSNSEASYKMQELIRRLLDVSHATKEKTVATEPSAAAGDAGAASHDQLMEIASQANPSQDQLC